MKIKPLNETDKKFSKLHHDVSIHSNLCYIKNFKLPKDIIFLYDELRYFPSRKSARKTFV